MSDLDKSHLMLDENDRFNFLKERGMDVGERYNPRANPSNVDNSNNVLYDSNNLFLELTDTLTGKPIHVHGVTDNSRLSRNIHDARTLIYDMKVPKHPTEDFNNGYEPYNPRSCVEALGFYITDNINAQLQAYGANYNLSAIEDKAVMDDLTFRNYIKGGAGPRNIYTNESKEIKDDTGAYTRVSANLGIGLGESAVLNPPFQFNKRDDVRTNPMYTKIGRVYSSQIMNNWPVVLFQPGRLKYNTGFKALLGGLGWGAGMSEAFIRTGGEGVLGIFSKFMNAISDVVSVIGTIGSAIFGGSKIVEFKQAIRLYNQYVSFLWLDLAGIMGLMAGHQYVGAIDELDITHVLPTLHMSGSSGTFGKYLNDQYIPFRCSKDVVGSESFTNSMTSNPLMEEMNDKSSQNSEETNVGAGSMNILETVGQTFKKAAWRVLGNFSERAAIFSGKGRATLPDVYVSSSFSRSFTFNIKLHYPYGDSFGKFENLYIQLCAILAMGLPRQVGKMSYTSPFAVKVFVKNQILISYGMFESISVTRGGDINDWGPDGFPKTLSIDCQIKDMEPNISLPLASRGPLRMALEVMFPTTGMSEYLGSIGGLSLDQMTHNFRKDHLKRATNMFTSAWAARFDLNNIVSSVVNTNVVSNIMGLFTSVDLDHYYELGDLSRENIDKAVENTSRNVFALPGYIYHASAMNGSPDGYKLLKDLNREDLRAMKQLEADIGADSSIYNQKSKKNDDI